MTKPRSKPKTSGFDLDLFVRVCDRVADGEVLKAACITEGTTGSTFLRWADQNPEAADQYARAMQRRAEDLAAELLVIADDGTNDTYVDDEGNARTDHDVIARSRLRVDTRKWLLSKLLPKRYGDKLAVGGAEDLPPIRSEGSMTVEPSEAYKLLLGR
jgi:hypothetical protein